MGVSDKYLKVIRWGFSSALVVLCGGLFLVSTNQLVKNIFDRFRPKLEKELAIPLGHPLVIGPYKGLRPWGIAIGSTELQSGANDESTARFSGLSIKYAPIASLLNWQPVLVIRPKGTSLNLVPNQNGSYWVMGETDSQPPNFGLIVKLLDPARIKLKPSDVELLAVTNSFLKIKDKQINGSIQLNFPGNGKFFLKGKGYWDRFDLQARARLQNIKLDSINDALVSNYQLTAQGKLDGDIQIQARDTVVTCDGVVALENFTLRRSSTKEAISSSKSSINCHKDKITIPVSQWEYGPWRSSLQGLIDFNQRQQNLFNIKSFIRLEDVEGPGLAVTAQLPFRLNKDHFELGNLLADFELKPFPLSPI